MTNDHCPGEVNVRRGFEHSLESPNWAIDEQALRLWCFRHQLLRRCPQSGGLARSNCCKIMTLCNTGLCLKDRKDATGDVMSSSMDLKLIIGKTEIHWAVTQIGDILDEIDKVRRAS